MSVFSFLLPECLPGHESARVGVLDALFDINSRALMLEGLSAIAVHAWIIDRTTHVLQDRSCSLERLFASRCPNFTLAILAANDGRGGYRHIYVHSKVHVRPICQSNS